MQETDLVALTRNLPECGLQAGDVGTIVLVHNTGTGYEVEFTTFAGRTLAIVTLHERDIRPIDNREVPHARHATVVGEGSKPARDCGIDIFPGITSDPSVRFGRACLEDTRIDVATVVGALAAGESTEAVEQAYALTREQVLRALRFAAHVLAHLPPTAGEVP